MATQFPTVVIDMILSFLPEYEFIDEIRDKIQDIELQPNLILNKALPKKISDKLLKDRKCTPKISILCPNVDYFKSNYSDIDWLCIDGNINMSRHEIDNFIKDNPKRFKRNCRLPYNIRGGHYGKEHMERHNPQLAVIGYDYELPVKYIKNNYDGMLDNIRFLLRGSETSDLIKDDHKLCSIGYSSVWENPRLIKYLVSYQILHGDNKNDLVRNPAIFKELPRTEEINDLISDLCF